MDWLQAGIDFAGIAGDVVLVAAPEGPGELVETAVTFVEFMSLAAAVDDAISGDPRGLTTDALIRIAKNDPVFVARAGRLVPLVGSLGSGYSLYDNFVLSGALTATWQD